MKNILIILFLALSLFAKNNDPETMDYIEHNGYSKYVYSLKTYVFPDYPNMFFINVSMLNKNDEKVSFRIVQEYTLPITDCTFAYEKSNSKGSSLSWTNTHCNNLLSEKGELLLIKKILTNIDNKLGYIYNQGE